MFFGSMPLTACLITSVGRVFKTRSKVLILNPPGYPEKLVYYAAMRKKKEKGQDKETQAEETAQKDEAQEQVGSLISFLPFFSF